MEWASVVIDGRPEYHGSVSSSPPVPIRVSASGYTAYRDCPALFGARLDGKFGKDSIASFKGRLAHAVFAHHLESGEIAPHDFDGVCRRAIGGSSLNFRMAELGLGISAMRETISEVGEMYERFKKLPVDGFKGAEVHLEVDVATGVTILGRIDAIYDEGGAVRLVDWKSGELGEVADQLRFYALLWQRSYEEMPVAIEAFSVRTGESHREHPTAASIEEVAEEVAALVEDVRSGDELERRPGMYCRFCPILDECSEGQAAQRVAIA